MNGKLPIAKQDKLIALTESIAAQAYEVIDSLPESEQWDLQAKIRRETVDAVANIAEACGTVDPRDATWRLGQGRGNLAALQSLLKLTHRAEGLELDLEAMVNIEQALSIIDAELPLLPAKTKKWMAANYPAPPSEDKK